MTTDAPPPAPSPSSPLLRTVLFAATLLSTVAVAADATHAQDRRGRRGGGRGRQADGRSAEEVLEQLLAAAEPSEEDFNALIMAVFRASTDAGFPSTWEDPEALYTQEQIEFRSRYYGPLREQDSTRAFLRRLAATPSRGWMSFGNTTAAIALADHPDADDLAALIEGFEATPTDSRQLASIARQLGRAVKNLRDSSLPEDRVAAEQGLEAIDSALESNTPQAVGAALEGLYRAGEVREATLRMRDMLREATEPAEIVPALQATTRLFQVAWVDPILMARAVGLARTAAEQALANSQNNGTRFRALSAEATEFSDALTFLRTVTPETQFDFLLECMVSRPAQELLTMDGIQQIRMSLQRARGRLGPGRRAQLDDFFLGTILESGERLFALAEEPMDREEYSAFFEGRDLRYNALSYFTSLWDRAEDVPELWAAEPDAVEYLGLLATARAEEVEGEDDDPLYYGVREKLENRVLSLELLARIQRDLGEPPGDLDLTAELLTILAAEVGAPDPLAEAAVLEAVGSASLWLELPVVRAPSDRYVQNQTVVGLRTLGYEVETRDGVIRIRRPEDTAGE